MLVWRLDRWGRSVTDLLATLQELEHLGVGFVSLTEALDLTTPAGRAMAGLTAGLQATEIRKLHRAGVSKSEIARQLQIGRTSVRRIFADRTPAARHETCWKMEIEQLPCHRKPN